MLRTVHSASLPISERLLNLDSGFASKYRKLREFSICFFASEHSCSNSTNLCCYIDQSKAHTSGLSFLKRKHQSFLPSSKSYSSSGTRVGSIVSETLSGNVDKYNSVWIDLSSSSENGRFQSMTEKAFAVILRDSIKLWKRQGSSCIWLMVPMSLSQFIRPASIHGFQYHHAEGTMAVLYLWMDESKEIKIPRFATHQIGVSGIVIDEAKEEMLVVKDRSARIQHWKFPGGMADLQEDIAATALREVYEETGVQAKFKSILAFRQQHDHPGAFGRSDIYFLCRLEPLTFDLNPCVTEIADIRWMPVQQVFTDDQVSPFTRLLAGVAAQGLNNGFQGLDIVSSEVRSIYKPDKFQTIFHSSKFGGGDN